MVLSNLGIQFSGFRVQEVGIASIHERDGVTTGLTLAVAAAKHYLSGHGSTHIIDVFGRPQGEGTCLSYLLQAVHFGIKSDY